MPTTLRERAVPLGLAVVAYGLAFAQRPGLATSDTKIDLHVDPVGFLADVAAPWSPTADLGHVQGGQYGGYLFPMAPFFALLRVLGAEPWVAQRLWLGTLFLLAAWGTVRLLDALLERPRGLAQVAAGLLVVLNPYVVVFAARTSVTLLGYAALPWLLLAVHRGLRTPRGWWWPAAFGLLVTATGGGVNAAVTAWILLGPVLLGAYELWTRAADRRAGWSFAWRAALCTAAVSVWWVLPVLVQAAYGVDFLQFTEQPGTIWATTSLAESLRLMGYWVSYIGVGYGGVLRPYFGDGGVLLFSLPVVLAGLLVPALALAGFAWTRRWRYAPFFLALALLGLVTMTAGFPDGTPLRRALTFTYNQVVPVQFLRTTYKAGPLLALAIACLGGVGLAEAVRRLRPRGPVVIAAVAVVALALPVAACWPLVRGEAQDSQLSWEEIPPAWTQTGAWLDRELSEDERAVVLPGQLYAAYDWGGTVDPLLPALTERPVAVRNAVPYADLHAVDLLWTLDALVAQRRAVPGQLDPLLRLLGAGAVVSGADDDRTRSGAANPADAADVLDGLGRPDAGFGAVRPRARTAGTLGAPRTLPRTRAWRRPGAAVVRVRPAEGSTVVDGGGEGIAALAGLGGLPRDAALLQAGDLSASELRAATRGGELVVTDSNRRRVLVASRMTQNAGATLAASDPIPVDAAVLDPFDGRGPDAQTVAVLDGARAVRADFSPNFPQFPEQRPVAALDGDPRTAWLADRALDQSRWVLEVELDAARDVPYVDLLPYSDARGRVTEVEVAGRRFGVRAGWNRLRVGLRGARSLRVRLSGVAQPPGVTGSPGGIAELRIPGVRIREALRPPVLGERALAGTDLSETGLSYVFTRTTGDDPFRREPGAGEGRRGLKQVRDRGDGETGLRRVFSPPAARSWTADGWATAAPEGTDPALDRLAGVAGGARFTGSPRFQGLPGARASSAFDGTARSWLGTWGAGRAAWLEWSTPQARTVRGLRLAPPRERVRRPTAVRLRADGGPPTGRLTVGRDGSVVLPAPLRGRAFRLEILAARFPPGTAGAVRRRRAVGVGELAGEGIPRARVRRAGALRSACGAVAGRLGGQPLRLRVAGRIEDLDAGRPLRSRGCGPAVALGTGEQRLEVGADAPFRPYALRLRAPAPRRPPLTPPPGRILDAGTGGRGERSGVRLELDRPAWLVLAEGHNRGWRARCDGRDLGAPRVVDGFGMGWRAPAGCSSASFAFAPTGAVRAGYAISGVAALVLLLLVGLRRPPRPGPARAWPLALDWTSRRSARDAAIVAVPAALALGFVFAARATPLFALAVFLIVWRGIGARVLTWVAGALLVVVVPVLTLLIEVEDRGGYNGEYGSQRIAVHWVAVAAVALLAAALARSLSTARGRRARGPDDAPPAEAAPARAP